MTAETKSKEHERAEALLHELFDVESALIAAVDQFLCVAPPSTKS